MKIEYTARNFTISPAIKKHINDHFKKLNTLLNGATQAHVILSVGKHHRNVAEIVVNWQDRSLTSKADTTDMYASSLQAIDKLHKQVLKLKGKIIDRTHNAKPAKSVAPSPVPPSELEKEEPRIIRSRRYSIKPMTPEEAVLRVEESADQFVVFRDSETDRIGVIYKRKDGNFGLIEP
ncbi:MAG TPA: ribosome-associated translation inhibitor RaiA [Blastocatellia bacterium]|nr:ribosome-associated translation inhibitor RaiA [Blastocatellia bacterium]